MVPTTNQGARGLWRAQVGGGPHGPQVAPGSWAFNSLLVWTAIFIILLGLLILSRQWHDPAPPGRVIPSSYIPNIRPQVDLNLFTSIFSS